MHPALLVLFNSILESGIFPEAWKTGILTALQVPIVTQTILGVYAYACFFDLRKAFDTVSRSKLFYNLLTEYGIGGNFLALLRSMYDGNKISVSTPYSLLEPFKTTTEVLQGDNLSPYLFNLLLNKTPNVLLTQMCC